MTLLRYPTTLDVGGGTTARIIKGRLQVIRRICEVVE